MFYEPAKGDHGLPFNPFKALVVPRPIGWISSRSAAGVDNLAPYSFFNGVADKPPLVAFSSSGFKDSAANIEETGAFIVNLASGELFQAMNASSAPVAPDVDEFDLAGLKKAPGRLVRVSRVAEAPAALECLVVDILPLQGHDRTPTGNHLVIGEVIGVHIADDVLTDDGRVAIDRLRPLARLGYDEYTVVEHSFRAERPPR